MSDSPAPPSNLFDMPSEIPEEITADLLRAANLRIERIVSYGQASPPDFWYDQEENEWVVVLQGSARLQFEDEEALLELGAGDYVNIPARRRHRVDATTTEEPTIWLAVFYGAT